MKLIFEIDNNGEIGAGISPYYNKVNVTVDYNPGGEDGEFLQYMRSCIAEWFDGSKITVKYEQVDEAVGKEAIEKLIECQKDYDTESAHADADNVLCSLLESLGYKDVVKEYIEVDKWYA